MKGMNYMLDPLDDNNLSPEIVARYLQKCSGEDFVETFVWLAKIHDLYPTKTGEKIEASDVKNFPMDTTMEFLKNSINEALNGEEECWWNEK